MATTLTALAALLCGYSLFSALALAITHFRRSHYPNHGLPIAMGWLLLFALGGLQVMNFLWLQFDQPWVTSGLYQILLFTVAPAFFLFSQTILRPQPPATSQPLLLGHLVPIALAPWLPSTLALPLAFLIGAGYLLWLGFRLYGLRQARSRFQLELMLLGAVFLIALVVSLLGLMPTLLPGKLFFDLYAIAIGLAFLLVQLALGLRPELPAAVSEVSQAVYAKTTLTQVDCDRSLQGLRNLMDTEQLYTDSSLSLGTLAQRLGLTTHQLSELMNTRLGKGFSRYLREQRVAAAKSLLLTEPTASVLSIGLSVGFSSQSNFYEAFREIEGMTPGQYRKIASHHPAGR